MKNEAHPDNKRAISEFVSKGTVRCGSRVRESSLSVRAYVCTHICLENEACIYGKRDPPRQNARENSENDF